MTKPASEKASGINWNRILDLEGMRKDDGSPDIPAVLRFMEEDVSSYISKYELSPSEIQEACEKAYSKHPGGLDFKGMCTRALQEIVHVPDGAEGKIMNRIADHLRIESNKFKSGKDGKWLVSPGHAARVQMVTMDFADQYWEKQEAKAAKNIDG